MQQQPRDIAHIWHHAAGGFHLKSRPPVTWRKKGEDPQILEEEDWKKFQQEDKGEMKFLISYTNKSDISDPDIYLISECWYEII